MGPINPGSKCAAHVSALSPRFPIPFLPASLPTPWTAPLLALPLALAAAPSAPAIIPSAGSPTSPQRPWAAGTCSSWRSASYLRAASRDLASLSYALGATIQPHERTTLLLPRHPSALGCGPAALLPVFVSALSQLPPALPSSSVLPHPSQPTATSHLDLSLLTCFFFCVVRCISVRRSSLSSSLVSMSA